MADSGETGFCCGAKDPVRSKTIAFQGGSL